MDRGWPLVGRGEELALLHRAMHRTDGRRGMVLAGAAGVGKTRLAREALQLATTDGLTAYWVSATSSSRMLPLGALTALVGDVGSDPSQVLQRAADRLLTGPGGTQPLLVIDDAHLLDDLSAALIQQMAVHEKATLVLTVRSGEAAPGAVESLWKDRFLGRVDVQALSSEETGTLVARAVDGPVDDRTVQRLFDLTGGNVLFLRHVVDGEVKAGRLADTAGVWRWSGEFAASAQLADLLDHRLAGLPPKVLDVLDLVAVGGALRCEVLGTLVPIGSIEQAETAGLVQITGDPGSDVVGFAHPLYGEVRRARLGRLRARRLRGLVATALGDSACATESDVLRRGVLTLDSDLPPDPALLTSAAQAALRLLDWQLGARLAREAARADGGFEAALTYSYALGFGLDPVAAEEELQRLAATATNDVELLQASLPRAGHLFYMQGRTADACKVIVDVRRRLSDASLKPLVDCMGAMFEAMVGDPLEAAAMGRAALSAPGLPPQQHMCAIWALAVAHGTTGQLAQLPQDAVHEIEIAKTSYESSLPSLGYADMHMVALRISGDVRQAERVAGRFRVEMRELTAPPTLFADGLAAHAALAAGRVLTARQSAERANIGLRGRDTSGWLYRTSTTLSVASAMSGDASAARVAAMTMEADLHPAFAFMEADRLLTWAWTEAAAGSLGAAIDFAHQAATHAAEHNQWGYEAYALATSVRFGDTSCAARLVELAAKVDGPRAPAAARQAQGLDTADGVALLDAANSFEEAGDLLSAADAAAQATSVFRNAGLLGSANAAMSRAARLQEACEGARTPALRAAVQPLPLTAREREVVTLAASGLTNRQIADRLIVSVRTVEGHIYRAGTKLGTSKRAELRALLAGT